MTGLELKIERIKRGIKQFELSRQSRIRAPRLSVIENGRERSTPEEIRAIRRDLGESQDFTGQLNGASKIITINDASADRAYSTRHNLRLITELKATSYIAFKDKSLESRVCQGWNRLFHYYSLHKEEFMGHYHKRSNVESTFWMIKSKFGEQVRSKLPVTQINEVLCKILCHNTCCVIQSVNDVRIEADF